MRRHADASRSQHAPDLGITFPHFGFIQIAQDLDAHDAVEVIVVEGQVVGIAFDEFDVREVVAREREHLRGGIESYDVMPAAADVVREVTGAASQVQHSGARRKPVQDAIDLLEQLIAAIDELVRVLALLKIDVLPLEDPAIDIVALDGAPQNLPVGLLSRIHRL